MSNGNKFKGNNAKKSFRKKNPYIDFDEKLDEYGKVLSMQGGKHLTVQLLDNSKGKTVSAIIKGIHHRKIWYAKDELVIIRPLGNLYEVQGKVAEDDIKAIQRRFDKLEGNNNGLCVLNDDDDDNDNDDDADNSQRLRKINVDNKDKSDMSEFDFNAI
jgi:translation initiation factor IF-1